MLFYRIATVSCLLSILFLFTLPQGYSAVSPGATILCDKLKSALQTKNIELKEFKAPLDHSDPSSGKTSIFYWIRPKLKNSNPSASPLLLIHGGPGGNSLNYLGWSEIILKYPGDVIGLDLRGEGCSNDMAMDQDLSMFSNYRARNIVKDLELLRKNIYGNSIKWRVFGQSRGSVIAHYYLEMAPDALESFASHGYSMGSQSSMENYSHIRSLFSARASHEFVKRYPRAGVALLRLRNWTESKSGKFCFDVNMNGNKMSKNTICGADAVDGFSFSLVSLKVWPTFAASLEELLTEDSSTHSGIDETKANALLQKTLNGNNYVNIFNYIIGTNGLDMGHPSPKALSTILQDKEIISAPIVEGRFILNAILPWYSRHYGTLYSASADPIDYSKIRKFLTDYKNSNNKTFQIDLFTSLHDAVAGPEAYLDERKELENLATFHILTNSGHEGWSTEAEVANLLLDYQ